jgi:hypothetical protein
VQRTGDATKSEANRGGEFGRVRDAAKAVEEKDKGKAMSGMESGTKSSGSGSGSGERGGGGSSGTMMGDARMEGREGTQFQGEGSARRGGDGGEMRQGMSREKGSMMAPPERMGRVKEGSFVPDETSEQRRDIGKGDVAEASYSKGTGSGGSGSGDKSRMAGTHK